MRTGLEISSQTSARFTPLQRLASVNKGLLLMLPTTVLFLVFFAIPIAQLFAIAFNKSRLGYIKLQPNFTLQNFVRFFTNSLYTEALFNSLYLGLLAVVITLLLGYPVAYTIARTQHPGRNTFYMTLVLVPLQLDMVIRLYGMMTVLGDNGLINDTLLRWGLISKNLPLMYNRLGIVLALVQFCLPFMILSLVGVIRNINWSLVEAARSLGASYWRSFFKIIFPLSLPGVLAGALLVFAISVSSYIVPVLMGGWRVVTMALPIYQQIAGEARWQFGSAIAVILFFITLLIVYAYHRITQRYIGGLV